MRSATMRSVLLFLSLAEDAETAERAEESPFLFKMPRAVHWLRKEESSSLRALRPQRFLRGIGRERRPLR
jgi:hypothetical protein